MPASVVLGIDDDQIGPQRLAVLGDRRLERLRDRLPLGEHFVGQPSVSVEHELDPRPVDGRIGRVAVLVVVPLLVRQPQQPDMIRIVGIEPLRKHPHQHRQRQERAGDLDERQPFGVVAGDGHNLQ